MTETDSMGTPEPIQWPVIIVDSSDIREGKLEKLQTAMTPVVEFARANEPRMIAYSVYLNGDARVTVLQIHPDSASAEYHMTTAVPLFAGFGDLIRMRGIDVYCGPNPALLERLRRKAAMLGGGSVGVHDRHAGFVRFGASAAETGE